MKEQIARLGFEAWADNVIADAIENMDGQIVETVNETPDCTFVVRIVDGKATFTVRAYVPGDGWKYHDRTIKLKPAAKTGFSPFDPVGETMKRFDRNQP